MATVAADEMIEVTRLSILAATDTDGDCVSWSSPFWSRDKAAEFFARAVLAAILPVLREVAAKECGVETYEGDRPAHIKPRCQAAIRARFDQIAKEIEG